MKKNLLLLAAFICLITLKTTAQSCAPGLLTFATQADVDNFTTNYPGCTQILGTVSIQNTTITNLNGLSGVTSIGGYVVIGNNPNLTSLTGLNALTSIGSHLFINNNDALTSLTGLNALTSVGLTLTIRDNDGLTSVEGLDALTSVGGAFEIYNSPALTSLTALNSLTSIGDYLYLANNNALTSLSGLDNIDHTTITNLYIQISSLLSFCGVQSICDYLANPVNSATISGNATGCGTRVEVEAVCGCSDGIQNGDETGIDCGGSFCAACPTCSDGIQNGDETGIDCGGSFCAPCPTCFDNIQNGDETGIDCGGSVCEPCPPSPTCFDNIQNGDETGIDCGGSVCDPCNACDEYVIISEENMEIVRTIIHSGGIGVLNEDEFAEINDNSRVIAVGTFVKAPEVDVNGGSQVSTIIEEQADPCMPEFLYNTNPSNNDVNVDEDETVTLSAAIYDDIEVEDGATVIFSGHQNVYIDNFDAGDNVTVIFNQCTNLRVKKEFRLGSQTDFNTANANVAVFSEDKIAFEGRNIAKGLFYTKEELIVHKAKSSDRNKLYGQYIGREADVAAYTDMYYQLYVPCNIPPALLAPEEENIEAPQSPGTTQLPTPVVTDEHTKAPVNISKLSVAPNPFNTETNISFDLNQGGNVVIEIHNLNGQLVRRLQSGRMDSGKHQLSWNGDSNEGNSLGNGIYFIVLKTNEQVIVEKVSLVR